MIKLKRAVITGIGIVSPIGIGRSYFWGNLLKGKSGMKPISVFRTFGSHPKEAGLIADADFYKHPEFKGGRYLDKSARFLLSAARLGLGDAGFSQKNKEYHNIDVVVASDWGYGESNFNFHRTVLTQGPNQISPMEFPNTVANAPASQVSIRLGLAGLNATISRGFTSGIDAMGYALNMLRNHKRKSILVAAVESLSAELYTFFYSTRWLPKSALSIDNVRLGEGSCAFLLEEAASAVKRGRNIISEVMGYGFSFGKNKESIKKSIVLALADARIKPDEIGYISSSINGGPGDMQEEEAIKEIFNHANKDITISSIKFNIGEGLGFSAAAQIASASLFLSNNRIPLEIKPKKRSGGSIGLSNYDKPIRKKTDLALVNSFGLDGNNACLVLRKAF
jgi:3-oxoacyl-[acyl-carrier-protein] synthase II